jgi:hypothetical protein
MLDGFQDGIAHPAGRCTQRVPPIFRDKRETAGASELDDSSFAIP